MKRWGLALAFLGLSACGGKIAPEESAPPNAPPEANAPPPGPKPSPLPPPSGAPLPPASPAPTMDAPILACGAYELNPADVLQRFGAAGRVALFRVAQVAEECSGLGGMHATLAFEMGCRDPRGAIHVGGHGCREKVEVGDLVVAAYDDTIPQTSPAWCLDELDASVGTARGYVLVSSRNESKALLAKFGCGP